MELRAGLVRRSPAALLAGALLLSLAACSGDGGDADPPAASASAAPVEVPDVPRVVATVDGREITRAEFARAYRAQYRSAGVRTGQAEPPDPDTVARQAVQSLVNAAVLRREARRQGVDPSPAEVQQTLSDLAERNGLGSAEAFVRALRQQGVAREEIEAQARRQTQLEQLLVVEGGPVEASDREVRRLYRDLTARDDGASVPPLAQVRDQLVTQVEERERQQRSTALVRRLRRAAAIRIDL